MALNVLFYIFAALALAGSLSVITSKSPVKAVLSLVGVFIATAVIWLILEAEFLALALIVVYVGAVMVLFLFVVMMLDIKTAVRNASLVRYWPLAALFSIAMVSFLIWIFSTQDPSLSEALVPAAQPANYSNIAALGMSLFTNYIYPFELAGMLLLAAMVAAITLTHRGRKAGSKAQNPAKQVKVNPKDRLQIVSMASEKKKSAGI